MKQETTMGISKEKTIVFDIGNTIIKIEKNYEGKMVDWPELTIIHGADKMLQCLSQEFDIVVASNAEDSNAMDVKKAMDRVNLSSYIQQYFTVNELKAKKPDQKYYKNLLNALQKPVEQLIMIGDDYQNDILPAVSFGIHSIWFNEHNRPATARYPMQEKECFSLLDIPKLIPATPLPSMQICYFWYLQQNATYSLLAHVNTVAAASYQLAIWLRNCGIQISPLLSHRGGFLHDISKFKENGSENHALLAYNFLNNNDQPELAQIARRHLIGYLNSSDNRPLTWEEKVVNYCDKLTEGSELVSLDYRLEALKQRYKDFALKIQKNTPFVKELEKEILFPLNLTPEDVIIKLKNALFNIE